MQKTGTITQIVPDGGYDSQGGYITTFQMTIQCPDGLVTGQIGSKTATYPLGVGSEISVNMTTDSHGTKFKKFNAQYAGQQGQQGSSQKPQNAPQSSGRDFDKENRGKCRFGLYQADISSGKYSATTLVNDAVELSAIETLVKFSMEGIGGTPNPNYVGEQQGTQMPHEPMPDDDIPF